MIILLNQGNADPVAHDQAIRRAITDVSAPRLKVLDTLMRSDLERVGQLELIWSKVIFDMTGQVTDWRTFRDAGPVGIVLELVETGIDTKIFQGTFSTTEDPSSPTSIQVKLGDFVVLDTQITGVISDNFFVTTGPTTNVVGSRGGIQVAVPNGDTNMLFSYNPVVEFTVRDSIGAGGGGGGLVRGGLVVNVLAGAGFSVGLFSGGGGGGSAVPLITGSSLILEPQAGITQLGQGFSHGWESLLVNLDDISEPVSIQTGEATSFTFDIYENQGITNLEHVTLYFFMGENSYLSDNHNDISKSDTYILFDTSKSAHVIDPHGYFENASFDVSEITPWKLKVIYDITFAKPMDTASLLIRTWDHDKNTADKVIVNALKVVEHSFLNAPLTQTSQETTQTELADIPIWVKNNAAWWEQKQIDDADFVAGIEYLINQNIIKIQQTETTGSMTADEIPDWIRNVAGFWANDSISDIEFISSMQWLISNGVMVIV